MTKSKCIAIDLGTCYSKVATFSGGKPTIIPNGQGEFKVPSKILLLNDGRYFVGTKADRAIEKYEGNNISIGAIKRKIGTDYSIIYNETKFFPQILYALILAELKVQAEKFLGYDAIDVVIAIPTNFSHVQRDIVREAAKLVGLNILRILNEAVVTAIMYGEKQKQKDETILIYDFGGGSFDVSLVNCGDGVYEVVGVDGDLELGGIDYDERIYNYIVEVIEKETGFDIRHDKISNERIREVAEKAKCELSYQEEYEINIPYLIHEKPFEYNLKCTISRKYFNLITQDLFDKSYNITERLLKDCGVREKELDRIVFTGGMTKIPAIIQYFKRKGLNIYTGLDRDLSVVYGAAYCGGMLVGECKDVLLLDVCPTSYGTLNLKDEFVPILPNNTTMPTRRSKIFTTSVDNQSSIRIPIVEKYKYCESLIEHGYLNLEKIPPAPSGIPPIEVSFDIDSNGIVGVFAKDLGTGKEVKTRLESKKFLTEKAFRDTSILLHDWMGLRRIELDSMI